MKHWTCIALTAALLAVTPATANDEGLSMRAASSLGHFIASQGNAALIGIRDEFRKDLRTRIKLYVPQRDEIAPDKQQAPAH